MYVKCDFVYMFHFKELLTKCFFSYHFQVIFSVKDGLSADTEDLLSPGLLSNEKPFYSHRYPVVSFLVYITRHSNYGSKFFVLISRYLKIPVLLFVFFFTGIGFTCTNTNTSTHTHTQKNTHTHIKPFPLLFLKSKSCLLN